VCLLMKLYLDYNFDVYHLKIVSDIKSDEYYVNMVRAWYFATALAKQYDAVLPLLDMLDEWTRLKTVQKACESYRITDDRKMFLRGLR
ncbi:MAG: DNA alkylation repair protein, partial [Clostridia bacterium]|nr:DNA alkylation repair protein [Clostridia bacterium]